MQNGKSFQEYKNNLKEMMINRMMEIYRQYILKQDKQEDKPKLFKSCTANDLYDQVYNENMQKYEQISNPTIYHNAQQQMELALAQEQQNQAQSYDIEEILQQILNQEQKTSFVKQNNEEPEISVQKQQQVIESKRKPKVEMIVKKHNENEQGNLSEGEIMKLIKDQVKKSVTKLIKVKQEMRKTHK